MTPTQINTLRNVVARIALRADPTCQRLADLLDSVIDNAATEIRVFDHRTTISGQLAYRFGAGSAAGGSWLALSKEFLDQYHTSKKRVPNVATGKMIGLNLEDILVHEADHLEGWTNGQEHTTSLSMAACGSSGAF